MTLRRRLELMTLRRVMLFLLVPLSAVNALSASSARSWDVVLRRGAERHTVSVNEDKPLLKVIGERRVKPTNFGHHASFERS